MNEIWKDIENFEGLYQISNLGNVKALRKISGFLILKEKLLKPTLKSNGYIQIDLCKNAIRYKFYVHRLVAKHFINNCNNYPCVNHIDFNRSNNTWTNLEWCTYEYNNIHSINPKLKKQKIGKYSKEGVLLNIYNSALEAAKSMKKVRSSDILRCCRGERKFAYGFSWYFIY